MSWPPPLIENLPIWFWGAILAALGGWLAVHETLWSWPQMKDLGLVAIGVAAIAFDLRKRNRPAKSDE
jgi:hypothetical protein